MFNNHVRLVWIRKVHRIHLVHSSIRCWLCNEFLRLVFVYNNTITGSFFATSYDNVYNNTMTSYDVILARDDNGKMLHYCQQTKERTTPNTHTDGPRKYLLIVIRYYQVFVTIVLAF